MELYAILLPHTGRNTEQITLIKLATYIADCAQLHSTSFVLKIKFYKLNIEHLKLTNIRRRQFKTTYLQLVYHLFQKKKSCYSLLLPQDKHLPLAGELRNLKLITSSC